MESEKLGQPIIEQETAERWKKIVDKLPKNITDDQKRWAKKYLEAQIAYSFKDSVAAYKIFDKLNKKREYLNFEDGNPALFAALDIVAKNTTNRVGVEPLFTLNS